MKIFGGILIVLLAIGVVFLLWQGTSQGSTGSGKKVWSGSAGLTAQQRLDLLRYPEARRGAGHI